MSMWSGGLKRIGSEHNHLRSRPALGAMVTTLLVISWTGPGCNIGGGNSNGNHAANDNVIRPGETISSDMTVDSLTLREGESITVTNGAVITITGDLVLDGSIISTTGPVTLVIGGAATIGGGIRAVRDEPVTGDDTAPMSQQPTGIFVVVGHGGLTMGAAAVLETDGHTVITDDAEILDRSPRSLADELEDVGSDDLPTFVPLPPESDAFADTTSARTVRDRTRPPLTRQAAPLAPILVSGVWPPDGAPPPATDQPIVILRFHGPRDVFIVDWRVHGPPAPAGAANDQSGSPGSNATGGKGKNGLTLNIRNNGGPINVQGDVTLILSDGGDGAAATAVCATATGGDGGKPGNFRMTAAGGIDLTLADLTIVPGRGGNGGAAVVRAGARGASGCGGQDGGDAIAQGGRGADHRKALFVRGNISGLENVTIAAVIAGNGGPATATACDGGDGDECCAAGMGGDAVATGGRGGDASIDVKGLPVTVGDCVGGTGGNATATGGNGGKGGDCKFEDGGDGGDGGDATAAGGAGGSATGGTAIGGNGGRATATGGNGGDSGGSALGEPGFEGFGGFGTATGGAGGAPDGAAGTPVQSDGRDGSEGSSPELVVFCFPVVVIPHQNGAIAAGAYEGPLVNPQNDEVVGSLTIRLQEQAGAEYSRGQNPDHIGIENGILEIDMTSLTGAGVDPSRIAGIRIAPLYATGISNKSPLRVEARDADGFVLGSQLFDSVPDNQNNPEEPSTLEAIFNAPGSIALLRIVVPEGAFVTIIEFCLIDP